MGLFLIDLEPNRAKGLLVNSKYKEIELKNRSLFLERYYFRFSSIKKTHRYSSITAITDGGHSEIRVAGMYSRTTNPLVVGNTKSLFFIVKSPEDNLLSRSRLSERNASTKAD